MGGGVLCRGAIPMLARTIFQDSLRQYGLHISPLITFPIPLASEDKCGRITAR